MSQNVSSTTLVAVLVIAVVIILGVASWLAFGRTQAYYGGKRVVPRQPPTLAAVRSAGPRVPGATEGGGTAR